MHWRKKKACWAGGAWLAFLLAAYFIPLTREKGVNYLVKDTLLGVMIAHNAFVLAAYLFIGAVLVLLPLWRERVRIE